MAKPLAPGREYYRGGRREVFAGVPMRVSQKLGKTTRALMVAGYREPRPTKLTPEEERAQLQNYAAALGITVARARGIIAAHQAHLAAFEHDTSDLV